MTEKTKIEVTLFVETLSLERIENFIELWLKSHLPRFPEGYVWLESPEEFLERKNFILPLLINKKLEIYEAEYPLSDI